METQRVYPSVSRINYASLMQKRIRKVLLICSSYDAYSLEEDGRIVVELCDEGGRPYAVVELRESETE